MFYLGLMDFRELHLLYKHLFRFIDLFEKQVMLKLLFIFVDLLVIVNSRSRFLRIKYIVYCY